MGNIVALLLTERLNNIRSFFCLEGNLVAEDCQISQKVSAIKEENFINKIYPLTPSMFSCQGLVLEKTATPLAFYRSSRSLIYWSCKDYPLNQYQNLTVKKAYFYGDKNKELYVLDKLKNIIDIVVIKESAHFMMKDNPI